MTTFHALIHIYLFLLLISLLTFFRRADGKVRIYTSLRTRVSFIIKWFDIGVGIYIDQQEMFTTYFIFPIPCFGFKVTRFRKFRKS